MTLLSQLARTGPVRDVVAALRHRGLGEADLLLASYPKSGNTWTKFMLAELAARSEVDFVSAEGIVPEVGGHRGVAPALPCGGRLIKTHYAYRPAYRKAIYIVRDVRDVVISYYHYKHWKKEIVGDLDSFLDSFLVGRADAYGTWHQHVISWVGARDAGADVLTVRYEDMIANAHDALAQMVRFAGIDSDATAIDEVIAHNRIERMRAKEDHARSSVFRNMKSDGAFVRKGGCGAWRDELNTAQAERIADVAGYALRLAGYQP